MDSLPGIDTILPMTGGLFVAGALAFFGLMLVFRRPSQLVPAISEGTFRPQLEDEIQQLSRRRMRDQLESQFLNDFIAEDDFHLALATFLKRLVPRPSTAFAAIVGVGENSGWPKRGRGLSETSLERLSIPDELIQRLKFEDPLIVRAADDSAGLFQQLDDHDRANAFELHLTSLSDGGDLFAILVTTAPWMTEGSDTDRRSFMKRLSKLIGMRWRYAKHFDQQSQELRATRDMLELRTIIDSHPEEPLETLERFAARLCESTQADRASIYFVARRNGERLQPIVQCGRPMPAREQSNWYRNEHLLSNLAIDADDGSLHDEESLRDLQIDSLMTAAAIMPIHVKGRVLGALCLTTHRRGASFECHKKLVENCAHTLSQTLRRVLDEATIRRQARHDHLTDLVNRRSFEAYLATEIERIEHKETPACSLILADLDRFKSYNDRFGHQGGDQVLRRAAHVLAQQVSHLRLGEHSIVARYGGEEFAILLPNVGLAGAMRIAESIRAAIESEMIRIRNETVNVTISLGVAVAPLHGSTAESLVAAADKALYQAKSNGRNCVCQPDCATEDGRALVRTR